MEEYKIRYANNKLNSLIGLKSVKKQISEVVIGISLQNDRKKAGQKILNQTLHMIFTGNPGTGKTTVARLVADIFWTIGAVSKGQLVEVTRQELVGEYIGQTAIKTQKIIDSAIGGVLFIDEAYSLSRGYESDFGREAIDTLIKAMEDYRDDLVVILAGYTNEMNSFLKSNSGLKSRIPFTIEFPDYTVDELICIARNQLLGQGFLLNPEITKALRINIEKSIISGIQDQGNARLIRNMIDKTIRRQSRRLKRKGYKNPEELKILLPEDLMDSDENIGFDLDTELKKIVGNDKLNNTSVPWKHRLE